MYFGPSRTTAWLQSLSFRPFPPLIFPKWALSMGKMGLAPPNNRPKAPKLTLNWRKIQMDLSVWVFAPISNTMPFHFSIFSQVFWEYNLIWYLQLLIVADFLLRRPLNNFGPKFGKIGRIWLPIFSRPKYKTFLYGRPCTNNHYKTINHYIAIRSI